jgi:hypothetical protein
VSGGEGKKGKTNEVAVYNKSSKKEEKYFGGCKLWSMCNKRKMKLRRIYEYR